MALIRVAVDSDSVAIRAIYLAAFPEVERNAVAQLALDLLNEQTIPETINLVAEKDGALVGHVAFSPVSASAFDNWQAHILAPLAVDPAHQKIGVGTKLVENGIAELSGRGTKTFFVYGDPNYYGRFGFSVEAAAPYRPPYALEHPFGWQAIVPDDQPHIEGSVSLACVGALSDPALW